MPVFVASRLHAALRPVCIRCVRSLLGLISFGIVGTQVLIAEYALCWGMTMAAHLYVSSLFLPCSMTSCPCLARLYLPVCCPPAFFAAGASARAVAHDARGAPCVSLCVCLQRRDHGHADLRRARAYVHSVLFDCLRLRLRCRIATASPLPSTRWLEIHLWLRELVPACLADFVSSLLPHLVLFLLSAPAAQTATWTARSPMSSR